MIIFSSFLDPAARVLVVGDVLTWVVHLARQVGQSDNRTDLWLRLFLVILAIDGLQVVRPLLAHHFNRLEAFVDVDLLLLEVFAIGSVGVEFVALRVVDLLLRLLRVRVPAFLDEVRAIGSASVERLAIGVELVVLDEDLLFGHTLGAVLVEVLRSGAEGDVLVFLLDSRDYLLSHLRLLPRVMLAIGRIDVVIGPVILRLCIRKV